MAAPEVFATRGYAEQGTQGRIFDAPDDNVLPDEGFLATHCFRLASADQEHQGQVGIEFEPAQGRDGLVDVRGVLWIDRTTPALQSVTFQYTGIEIDAIRRGAGGWMTFRTMPNVVVFVDRWNIRTITFTRPIAGPSAARLAGRGGIASSIHEGGGEVAHAEWPGGVTYDTSLGSVRGRVLSADRSNGVANALVWLEGTDYAMVTDSAGSFVTDGRLPGPYDVAAAIDESLAAARIDQTSGTTVEMDRSPQTGLRPAMRSVDQTIASMCGGQRGAGTVLAVTAVMDDGLLAEGASVEILLTPRSADGARSQYKAGAGVADAQGRFVVCNVADGAAEIRVGFGVAPLVTAEESVANGEVVHAARVRVPTRR